MSAYYDKDLLTLYMRIMLKSINLRPKRHRTALPILTLNTQHGRRYHTKKKDQNPNARRYSQYHGNH